ncbi:trypsin-like peptidase domain-containing protein [Ruminococcus sp. FMB-CY1]|uniref:S1C family serine protease n=1 Tax=unclassified Ruminococcus TaxID=2608920 RepID=UPI00208F5ABF|nr:MULTISPECIES: trypsin-like peptidase domain-containing protein [unclassified Ruminococcus]USP69960.1 trypsin-like peptidase domain-containing protein [Ruminococcus sp. FMBCY1]WBX56730.1 trypsin-like peptidase domain-containing protein [Ruminococcus sp. FMB-CY1]
MLDNKNPNEFNDIYSGNAENTPESNTDIPQKNAEASYEWNSDKSDNKSDSTEYHYSYVNGNNKDASHNPNRYNEPTQYSSQNTSSGYSNNYQNPNTNAYDNYQSNGYTAQNQQSQNVYNSQPYGTAPNHSANAKPPKAKKPKKQRKPISRGGIAIALAVTMVFSCGLGFGGGYFANKVNTSTSGSLNITKTSNSGTTTTASSTSKANSTSEIVKKTADSVVEISTESVVTGSFAQQYVQQGAGSGVIISQDGYILTNNHVINGANSVKVRLRDSTEYDATIIGSDSDNDIALLKVSATGLSPATFGDSNSLAVGDYVVAIGNPLGELGGTVTDGIISALARKVTIEDTQMTLLQTNAQVNPGNSGGGLFNANGELVGIVNAKQSATEVEGIAFAIPINNVLDILSDLKEYGYVTGKVDLGIDFTDITSDETAFYYGVNQTGCYVLSVDSGSNAEKAGVTRGDLVTKVNDTDVSSSSDITTALEKAEVGDTVTFTVSRRGTSKTISFVLEEYIPAVSNSQITNGSQKSTTPTSDSENSTGDDSIWSQMFGW